MILRGGAVHTYGLCPCHGVLIKDRMPVLHPAPQPRRQSALRVMAAGAGGQNQMNGPAPRQRQEVSPVWPPPRPPGPFIDSWAELEPPDDLGLKRKTEPTRKGRSTERLSEEHKEKIRSTMKVEKARLPGPAATLRCNAYRCRHVRYQPGDDPELAAAGPSDRRQGRANRKPKSEEHKENIRKAMLRKMNMDSTMRLKISAAAKGVPKVCRICGTPGHNSRTCPQNPANKAKLEAKEAKAAKAKSKRRCSLCGQTGHYSSTCPTQPNARVEGATNRMVSASGPLQAPSSASVGAKRTYRCSICGEPGHSARTCPTRTTAASPQRSAPPPLPTPAATAAPLPPPPPQPPAPLGAPQPFPATRSEMCAAAVRAADAAYRDGILLQRVDLNLQRTSEGLDMESWAGGIREQFGVALPLVELFLGSLKKVGYLTGRMSAELIDEADAVGCWQNDRMSAVLFPTADTLGRLRELCLPRKGEQRLTIVINPQWQPAGQVISDFGFGVARREAEEFVERFEYVFCHRSLRLLGENICLFRCYPGPWELHLINRKGAAPDKLCSDLTEPSYRRIEQLVLRHLDRRKTVSWLDRVRKGTLWSR